MKIHSTKCKIGGRGRYQDKIRAEQGYFGAGSEREKSPRDRYSGGRSGKSNFLFFITLEYRRVSEVGSGNSSGMAGYQ